MSERLSETVPASAPPSLRRRLACGLYELVILFGVGLIPAAIGTLAAQWLPPGWIALAAMQAIGFLSFGIYFVWLWSHGGQTLPMQTWRIRLVGIDGQPPSVGRALARYFWSWLWLAPAVLVALVGEWTPRQMLAGVAVWASLYTATALVRSDRQFLHDVLSGTRLEIA